MENEEQNLGSVLDDYSTEALVEEEVVEQPEEETEEVSQADEVVTPEPQKEVPQAAGFSPEQMAKAIVELEEQRRKQKEDQEKATKPALSDEEFEAKFRPRKFTPEDIASALDLSDDLDAKQVKGYTELLNRVVEENYSKNLNVIDALLKANDEKWQKEVSPVVQKVAQYEQQQEAAYIGNRVKDKYPALAEMGYREHVAQYIFPKVLQEAKAQNLPKTAETVEKIVDRIKEEAITYFKPFNPDFDPTKKPTPKSNDGVEKKISQTKKTPAALSSGGQSGGKTAKGPDAHKTKSLLDVLNQHSIS